jgi:hypothetical protein
VYDIEVLKPFSNSDHDAIVIGLHLRNGDCGNVHNNISIVKSRRDWGNTDWESFGQYCLDINWTGKLVLCTNSDEYWLCISNVLLVVYFKCSYGRY